MRFIKKVIIVGSLSCLLVACHEADNPMVQPKATLALKRQLFIEAHTCVAVMSDPKHDEAKTTACTPWVDKQYAKYTRDIKLLNQYRHENNVVPVRADFNDPNVWKAVLALWKQENEKWAAEKSRGTTS